MPDHNVSPDSRSFMNFVSCGKYLNSADFRFRPLVRGKSRRNKDDSLSYEMTETKENLLNV